MNSANTSAALAPVLEAGGPELSRQLMRTEARLQEVAESHGDELSPHAAGTLAAGGKRLRPMLVFLCAGDASRQHKADCEDALAEHMHPSLVEWPAAFIAASPAHE